MYFEPAKKTYYRFPSSDRISNLDLRYYFPEKPQVSGEDVSYEFKTSGSATHRENHFIS